MKQFPRRFFRTFGLRTLFVITFLFAIFASLVITPELQRTSAFQRLEENGVAVHAPPVVLFGGPQPAPHITPEPSWHAIRQRINKFIGITTVPWYAYGELFIPDRLDVPIMELIRDLDDLKAIHNWDIRESAG